METTKKPQPIEIEFLGTRVTPLGILIAVYKVNGKKKAYYPGRVQLYQASDNTISPIFAPSLNSPQEN